MNRKVRLSIIFPLVLLFFTACDSERNQIISNLFSETSPTITLIPTKTILPSTATPTSQARSIISPEIVVGEGTLAMIAGDYEKAESIFRADYDENSGSETATTAGISIAHIQYKNSLYTKCLQTTSKAISLSKNEEMLSRLWYQTALCAEQIGSYQDVISAYKHYLQYKKDSFLAKEINIKIAENYTMTKDHELAREYYNKSLEKANEYEKNEIFIMIADSYEADGNLEDAITTLTDRFNSEIIDDSMAASIDLHLGQLYLKIGQYEQANAKFLDGVNNYPQYSEAYYCMEALEESGVSINQFQKAQILYYNGFYSLASEEFRKSMKSNSEHDGTAYYFIGVSEMYISNYESAILAFQNLIDNYPDNRFYVSAWDEISYIHWYYLDNPKAASAKLIEYVTNHPDSPDSAGFIYEAGRILERGGYLTEASRQWERLIDEYPLYEDNANALFLAGICKYRTNDLEGALAIFNRLLTVNAIPNDLARAHFWIAKTYEKKKSPNEAAINYQKAINDAPMEYYSLRAEEIIAGKLPLSFSEKVNLSVDLDQEKQIADQWMRLTFTESENTDFENSDSLNQNKNFLKGKEYWLVGDFENALQFFDNARADYENDPVSSYILLNQLINMGMYRCAAFTSRQILTSAGLIENVRTLSVPNYFNHIRYGIWYKDYILDAFNSYQVHPFILYALMRQESMYDPWIVSSAGARGLMQFMPATGEEISDILNWPNSYTEEDLNRAIVSIRFAGSYLYRMNNFFDRDNFKMLASYNAGAGNVSKWAALDNSDTDLFVEIIRFSETRNYINNVYEFAKMYEHLYAE